MVAMRNRRQVCGVESRKPSMDCETVDWVDDEIAGSAFQDMRHSKRLRQLLGQLAGKIGATTPWACQDWASTKAAYRFFGNDRISEANILAGHFAST